MPKIKKRKIFSSLTVCLAALFFVISLVSASLFFRLSVFAQGENVAPVASGVLVNAGEGMVLVEGTTTPAEVTATISDDNGCRDLASVKISFHLSGSPCSSAEDAANSNTCYFYEDTSPSESVACEGEGDLIYEVDKIFPVFYYADAGDWVAEVSAVDLASASTQASSDVVYIDNLLSLKVLNEINYGILASGYVSQGDNISRIANTGNMEFKIIVYGEPLVCTSGEVPIANQEYALFPFWHGYGDGNVLTNYGNFLDVELPKPSYSNIPVTDDIYWQVSIPADVSGACSGNVYYIATDDF